MSILPPAPDSNKTHPPEPDDLRAILDEIDAESGNEFRAQHDVPDLTDTVRRVLLGCDHLERIGSGFSSPEARMSYADAAAHIRACVAAGLTGPS